MNTYPLGHETVRPVLDNLTGDQRRQVEEAFARVERILEHNYGSVPDSYRPLLRWHAIAEVLEGTRPVDPIAFEREVHTQQVRQQAARLRAQQEAREQIAAEQAAQSEVPEPVPATEFINTHAETETTWRIEHLWPREGLVLLAAPAKSGKTTMMTNLLRSLADSTPFLEEYGVTDTHGVVLIDTEMTPGQLARWLERQDITDPDQLRIHALRGHLSGFNILDPDTRTRWAQTIAGAEVVILDNLRPVIDALGLDENHDAGRLLEAWKELLAEAGATDSLIVTHTGHHGERARGDSTLQDKPDALWTIVKDKDGGEDDHQAARYFKARGREVDLPERQLHYRLDTGRLVLGAGGRRDAKLNATAEAVHAFLRDSPGTSQNGIQQSVNGRHQVIAAVLKNGVEQGIIRKEKGSGRGGGYAYYLTENPEPASPVPSDSGNQMF